MDIRSFGVFGHTCALVLPKTEWVCHLAKYYQNGNKKKNLRYGECTTNSSFRQMGMCFPIDNLLLTDTFLKLIHVSCVTPRTNRRLAKDIGPLFTRSNILMYKHNSLLLGILSFYSEITFNDGFWFSLLAFFRRLIQRIKSRDLGPAKFWRRNVDI